MASKNSIKLDVENGYYHVYNRGVEKRNIFEDKQDYGVFLGYLKEYLSPVPDSKSITKVVSIKDTVFNGIPRQPNNYFGQIKLLVYSLIPNHFHFIIQQSQKGSMKKFIHSILLRYSMYFNKRYGRVGPLFQGRYKAVVIDNDSYLLHLSRYIHLNPSEFTDDLIDSPSSYADYLKLKNTTWLNTDIILSYFKTKSSTDFKRITTYKHFVEEYKKDIDLGGLAIDN